MSSRHGIEGTMSHTPLTHAEAKRLLEAARIDVADNTNQHSQQEKTTSDSLLVEPHQQESTKQLDSTTSRGNNSGLENPSYSFALESPPREFSVDQ